MRIRTVSCAHLLLGTSLALVGVVGCAERNGSGSGSPDTGPSVIVPQFPGAGTTAGDPLRPGTGPGTARDCAGGTSLVSRPTQVITQSTQCFYSVTTTTTIPSATIEQIAEVIGGRQVVHLRITFDPGFVDNSYGANAVGWNAGAVADGGKMPPKPGKGGHTFKDLVGSDHVELKLFDSAGQLALHFKVDYISEDPSRTCGYGTLGVTGGEGKMMVGNAASVLAVATSLDRDLNGCGYCYTLDSPATDASYTPNPATPRWDYRVVYEIWVDAAAYGAAGPGDTLLENVHASPSKAGSNTVSVERRRCPPTWPECKPDIITEGLNCGDAGSGCPPGTIEYIISEGRTCVPQPIPLPDGGLGCPPGHHLDLATEGRFCLPD
ncbi:MAG TPA: hypothetical protein VK550_32145 [Polyangiaceae bacterium]|nr:hypothetical protein [Polyangiaceae bacterium]